MVKKLLMTVTATMFVLPMGAAAAASGPARDAANTIQSASNRVQNMVTAARAQKDKIKLACVSEKAASLQSMNGSASALLAQADGAAGAAKSKAESDLARMADDARRIAGEAGECVGADGRKASADVDADGQAKVANADPTDPGSFTNQIARKAPGAAQTAADSGQDGVLGIVQPTADIDPAASPIN